MIVVGVTEESDDSGALVESLDRNTDDSALEVGIG
jgi:hypothetical protein